MLEIFFQPPADDPCCSIRPSSPWMTAVLFSVAAWVIFPGAGRADQRELPNVFMVEIPGTTPNDFELYKAIHAQLSAAPLRLNRIVVDPAQKPETDPPQIASKIAADYNASVVFWILDDGTTCTLLFYNKTSAQAQFHTRALDLVYSNLSSRYETIGNAVASVIEESVAGLTPKPPSAAAPATPISPPPAKKTEPGHRWMELFAGYAGRLFATDSVTHGIRMGLGLLPGRHIAIALSYTQNLPLQWQTDTYRFTLTPRNIETSIAGRLISGSIDIRLGVMWAVDLRSDSTDTLSKSVSPRNGELEDIHSLIPFLGMTWTFRDRFGIAAEVGADIALNERDYKIQRDDGTENSALSPYLVKLTYRLGFVVHL